MEHDEVVLAMQLHTLVEIVDQLAVVVEASLVAGRVGEPHDLGIVDKLVDGDREQLVGLLGALYVPHVHVVACPLEDGGEVGLFKPRLAVGHAVEAEGVFLNHRGDVFLGNDVGEGKEVAPVALSHHAGRGVELVAVEAGVVLDIALAQHVDHGERVALLHRWVGAVHLAGLLHGHAHVVAEGAQRVDGVGTLRAYVERRGGKAVAPAVHARRVAGQQQRAPGIDEESQPHGGDGAGHQVGGKAVEGPAQRPVQLALDAVEHDDHDGQAGVDGVAQLALGAPHVGVDKLAALLACGLDQHGERLLRDVHLKVEREKQRDAQQQPGHSSEQVLHQAAVTLPHNPGEHPHQSRLHGQALEPHAPLVPAVAAGQREPVDGLLGQQQEGDDEKHPFGPERGGDILDKAQNFFHVCTRVFEKRCKSTNFFDIMCTRPLTLP